MKNKKTTALTQKPQLLPFFLRKTLGGSSPTDLPLKRRARHSKNTNQKEKHLGVETFPTKHNQDTSASAAEESQWIMCTSSADL